MVLPADIAGAAASVLPAVLAVDIAGAMASVPSADFPAVIAGVPVPALFAALSATITM